MAVARAQASPITYGFTATGTGSIGGVGFSEQAITIIVQADTEGRCEPSRSHLANDATSATISIAGVGVAQFLSAMQANLWLSPFPILGLEALDPWQVMFDIDHPALATYNLISPFGPLFDAIPVFGGGRALTTLGPLANWWVWDITFVANTGTVPEPASLLLVGTGLFGLGRAWRRRRA